MTTLHYDAARWSGRWRPFPRWSPSRSSADLPNTLGSGCASIARRRARVRRRAPGRGCQRRDPAAAQPPRVAPRREGRLDPARPAARWGDAGGAPGPRARGRPAQLRPLLDRAYRAQDGVRVAMRDRPDAALRRAHAGGGEVGRGDTRAGRPVLRRRLAARRAPARATGGQLRRIRPAAAEPPPRRRRRRRPTGATGTTGVQPGPASGTSSPVVVQPQP